MNLKPEMSKLISRLNQNQQLTNCIAYLDEENYEKAIECFDEALERSPGNVDILFGKAITMSEINEWGKAIQFLTSILNMEPQNIEALKIKAEVFEIHGKIDLALGCYDRLVKIASKDDNVWLNRGLLFKRLGSLEEATASVKKAFRINPHNKGAIMMLGDDLLSCPNCSIMIEKGIECPHCDSSLTEETKTALDLSDLEENGLKVEGTSAEIETIAERLLKIEPGDASVSASELDKTTKAVKSFELLEDEVSDVFEEEDSVKPDVSEREIQAPGHSVEDELTASERVTTASATDIDDDVQWDTKPEREWMTLRDLKKSKKSSAVNLIGIFCIVAVAIYLMYISAEPIYNNLTDSMDFEVLVPNLIIFLLGLGALYGGVSAAKNSIIFDHFLNSTFESEIYQRLEPAFEEIAETQVRLEEIEIKMDRLNLNIQRYKRHPPVGEFPSLSIEGKISIFLKVVIMINITIGIFLFISGFPGTYAPYVFTLMFILWWLVITDEYKLWKNPTSWSLVVLPVFAVPVMSILLYTVIRPIDILIGLIGVFLTLYAFGYFTWARYYVEGVLPFRIRDDDAPEEPGEELPESA